MSKTAQQIIMILGILLLVASGVAVLYGMQKDQLEKNVVALNKQIEEFSKREKGYLLDNNKLKAQVDEVEKAKVDLEERLTKFKDINIDEIDKQLKKITADRDSWKQRVDALTSERDQLAAKLIEKAKVEEKPESPAAPTPVAKPSETTSALPVPTVAQTESEQDKEVNAQQEQDAFWAQVLKEKADVQLKVENLIATLNNTNVELVELKKKNSDMQLSLGELKSEKDAIEREIKHGKDLADSLSLELARAQNEKKFLNDRVEKLLQDNSGLRDQIKQLTSTKIALERSIVRLQDEKKDVEKKLMETENVIQSRVDQIWSIKESLDKDLKPKAKGSSQVELPPIVVSSQTPVANPSIDKNVGAPPGFNGNVVSINKENNFVIVDIGEAAGLKVGDSLSVYRGTDYIAGLEVIQLRKDIAAADIKEKVAEIQVGDVVR